MKTIEFRSTDAFLLKDAVPHRPETTRRGISGELYLPQCAPGPFPAVVLSHGLSGVSRSREHRYARLLAENGIAALVFDSFAARSAGRLADPLRALRVSETMLLCDAFAALSWLADRPDIRAGAISIVGFSYGGMISVLAAYLQIAETFLPGGPRFCHHAAYYGCSIPRLDDPTTTGAPVTMLIGEEDRNVDLDRTRRIVDDLETGGSKVDLVVYPQLYHQWDDADAGDVFVRLQIAGCRMRVATDGSVRDERTGLKMRGWWSRAAMLALSSSASGYHIRPDAEATAISDARLLRALTGRACGSVQAPRPRTELAPAQGPVGFGGLSPESLALTNA